MRRGDIYLVDLEPARGSEAGGPCPPRGSEVDKARPAVLVSNDAANRSVQRNGRGVLTVVPVTSNVSRVLPFQVRLGADDCGLPRDSKAQAEQVRSVAAERVVRRVGTVPAQLMRELDGALRRHLAL